MKKIAFLVFLSVFSSHLFSQNYNVEEVFKDDKIINAVFNSIPKGWIVKLNDGVILIEKTDSIWILDENWLKNPREDKVERNNRIKSKGRRSCSYIKIGFEKKWSAEELGKITSDNDSYHKQLNELPEKYKIIELRTQPSGKKMGGVAYIPKTNDDKKRLAGYEKEKESIEKLIRKIPDMTSEKYSLFIVELNGCIDDTHYVYPGEASVELFTILNNFRELCTK